VSPGRHKGHVQGPGDTHPLHIERLFESPVLRGYNSQGIGARFNFGQGDRVFTDEPVVKINPGTPDEVRLVETAGCNGKAAGQFSHRKSESLISLSGDLEDLLEGMISRLIGFEEVFPPPEKVAFPDFQRQPWASKGYVVRNRFNLQGNLFGREYEPGQCGRYRKKNQKGKPRPSLEPGRSAPRIRLTERDRLDFGIVQCQIFSLHRMVIR
jgi:hypothetical protein